MQVSHTFLIRCKSFLSCCLVNKHDEQHNITGVVEVTLHILKMDFCGSRCKNLMRYLK